MAKLVMFSLILPCVVGHHGWGNGGRGWVANGTSRWSSTRRGGDSREVTQCDLMHSCPRGETCAYSTSTPGIKVCVARTASDVVPRSGLRCPLPSEMQNEQSSNSAFGSSTQFFRGSSNQVSSCSFDVDCRERQRCCQRSNKNSRECMTAFPISLSPTVTVLMDGVFVDANLPKFMEFSATISLVQSNGFNVLFEPGSPANKLDLIRALREKSGLFLEDINYVVTSHGHMDHIGNSAMFPDIPNSVDGFEILGLKYTPTPLISVDLSDPSMPPSYINGDDSMQIIATPGHTLQDTSLIVYNVPRSGTITLAGDLILTAEEAQNTQVDERGGFESPERANPSRKTVICLSDYIIPGHGPIFEVTRSLKTAYQC